jgi:hypothetical protein
LPALIHYNTLILSGTMRRLLACRSDRYRCIWIWMAFRRNVFNQIRWGNAFLFISFNRIIVRFKLNFFEASFSISFSFKSLRSLAHMLIKAFSTSSHVISNFSPAYSLRESSPKCYIVTIHELWSGIGLVNSTRLNNINSLTHTPR